MYRLRKLYVAANDVSVANNSPPRFHLLFWLWFLPWAIQHPEFIKHHHLQLPVTLVRAFLSMRLFFCQSITFHRKNALGRTVLCLWSCCMLFDANLECFIKKFNEVYWMGQMFPWNQLLQKCLVHRLLFI